MLRNDINFREFFSFPETQINNLTLAIFHFSLVKDLCGILCTYVVTLCCCMVIAIS